MAFQDFCRLFHIRYFEDARGFTTFSPCSTIGVGDVDMVLGELLSQCRKFPALVIETYAQNLGFTEWQIKLF